MMSADTILAFGDELRKIAGLSTGSVQIPGVAVSKPSAGRAGARPPMPPSISVPKVKVA